jgi:tetratricopeptide (TPR) repeat protein
MRAKRWILLGAAVFFTTFVVWVVVSLRNDDSTLMVVSRYVKDETCWTADSSAVCALKTMAKYEKKGRYDDAISAGVALAQKYPDSFTSGWIYEDISELYLRRATMDSGRAEEYLKQAVFYRDKALPSHLDSDSPYSLNTLAALSESIGDLSTAQQCVQYRNSIKLLDRMRLLTNEDQHRLARQFKPNLDERQKLDNLLECIDVATKRVDGKLSASGCQKQHRSPG